jgi:hypothetical protein
MGIYARVRCNCWEAGQTSEPPVPRDWLRIGECGFLGAYADRATDEDFEKVLEWQESACDHPGMALASERIASYRGFEHFQEVLSRVSGQPFPTLVAEPGQSHPNQTSPETAERALAELAHLRSLNVLVPDIYVFNGTTGEENVGLLYPTTGPSGLHVDIDDGGFCVWDAETGAERFRSVRFRQTPLSSGRGPVELLDLDSGHRFRCPAAVLFKSISSSNRYEDVEGEIQFVPVTVEHYENIITALESVFRASVETRNPVHWS